MGDVKPALTNPTTLFYYNISLRKSFYLEINGLHESAMTNPTTLFYYNISLRKSFIIRKLFGKLSA